MPELSGPPLSVIASPDLSGRGNLTAPHLDCFVTSLLAMTKGEPNELGNYIFRLPIYYVNYTRGLSPLPVRVSLCLVLFYQQ